MIALVAKTLARRTILVAGKLVSLKGAWLLIALGTLAYGGPITIFFDDFQDDTVGGDPNAPPTGEPWQIFEPSQDGISVVASTSEPSDHVLLFGTMRNIAVAPFSAADVQSIQTLQNLTVSFDYEGRPSDNFGNYFDIGGYDGVGDNPGFLVRIDPRNNLGFHGLSYLDPEGGLVDSGLELSADSIQAVSISIDLAAENYMLEVDGNAAGPLPMLACPNDLHGIQFSNYGIAMASGSIDNLTATVIEPEPGAETVTANPEPATIAMLAIGALCAVFFGFLGLKKGNK